MFHRDIYPALEKHLTKRQVTVLTGMRRVGKSTAVHYLMNKLRHDNRLYLDCERVEIRALFNKPDYETIKEELGLMGFDFSQPGLIAIDEIQLCENLPSLIKYLYDTYGVKFVVTGSSSFYIKNTFSESLAGRKRIFELYPLNFREFLLFKGVWKDSYGSYSLKPFTEPWYRTMKDWYEEYVTYGGFPEVVLQEDKADKTELLLDIINSYIELDVKLLDSFSVSEDLYKLVKLLATRCGNKIDYSKLSSLTGINRQRIASYVGLLEHTYLLYQLSPFTKNIDREIAQQKKGYFSDTGILRVLAGDAISSGQVFENAIAAQLKPIGTLQYYQRKTGQEIDFIFNSDTAVEVKETPTQHDADTLAQRAKTLDIERRWLIGRYPPPNGFKDFTWAGTIF